ncbi:MAG: phosphate acyltransferase PlsX [Bacteroidota bacterium]|nr:phosphate acyltransferase PlsX [Bacteroidota bacterium]
MKVGLDVMGGDNAPQSTIDGAILARKEMDSGNTIVLIGDQPSIEKMFKDRNADLTDFEIIHAEEMIEMGEHPTKALRQKSKSSISIGFHLLKKGYIDAFSSAGNTGAVLVGAMYSVGSIDGVLRPATAATAPRADGKYNILLDVGTNPDAKPDVLEQFAILGKIYAETVFDIKNPKIGLLNLGEEKEKGNLVAKATYPLMKESTDYNFIGNIEGRDILGIKADVIVCDGFTGNVVLKQMESLYHILKEQGLQNEYLDKFNYENYGGTPVLGIKAPVLVGHGISNAKAIKNMILHSLNIAKADMPKQIENTLLHNRRKQ